MNNKKFGIYLETRTKKFAIMIIRLSSSLPNTIEYRVIKNQLVKSGTSIGANYREANTSRSKADFINRIKICQSETNETMYWLELVIEIHNNDSEPDKNILKEAKELFAIFTSIISKMRS
ncbi:MAG: four helix bundle protein [Bacteroidales bacterium]|nr:four helix bundle protein [Bacteroidales bacterium]